MERANLVISCPDQPGIVMMVTEFLFRHGTNISSLEQHIEDGYFFMRIEWELKNSNLRDEKSFREAFELLRQKLNMQIRVDFCTRKKRVGLFCSRELHCLIDILARVEIGELDIEIPYVISNFIDASSFVENFKIPFFYISTQNEGYEQRQLEILRKNSTDVIVLARYMKILSENFISNANQPIINVHHSFLPSFVGAKPYDEAYERGVKLIGATSHYVIPELDRGPIIEQTVKRIDHSSDPKNLKLVGRESEKEVLSFAIKKHIENKLVVYKNRVIVFQ